MNFGKTITVGALVGFAALCLISIDLANAEEEKNEGAALQEIIIEAPKAELKDTFEDFMPLPTAKFKVKKEEIETIKVLASDLLLKELTQKLISNKSTIVEIHADKNIEFGSFGNIIELARQAGAEEFIFATEDPQ